MNDRLVRERHAGIDMPESFLLSPRKVLVWRALVAGDKLNKHAVAARFGCHLSTADRILTELHNLGKAHVVGWTRNGARGPMTKVVAFGPGEDLHHPDKLDNAFVCKRWRARHEEQARRCYLASRAKHRTPPVGNDPLLFAIMGISRGARS